MKLIIGLGNPGREYEKTRHNAGFMVIDEIAKQLHVNISQNKAKGLYVKTKVGNEDIILLKPQTYMNLSGESVRGIMDFFKIKVDDILVIYDDLDLEIGSVRLRSKGSAGGQNGMKNIIQHVGTQEFKRIRVGIGKDARIKVVDYVLSKFRKDEIEDFEESVIHAKNAALCFVEHGFDKAMNDYNKK